MGFFTAWLLLPGSGFVWYRIWNLITTDGRMSSHFITFFSAPCFWFFNCTARSSLSRSSVVRSEGLNLDRPFYYLLVEAILR